jgi:hypothetical protein
MPNSVEAGGRGACCLASSQFKNISIENLDKFYNSPEYNWVISRFS